MFELNLNQKMNRKEFIKTSSMAAVSLAALPTENVFTHNTEEKVKLGIMGVGLRGQNHLELILSRKDVDVVAICDVDERMLKMAKEIISGKKMPEIYTGDPYAWRKMLDKKGLDAVIIATPWEWHKPMIVESVESGIKYVGSEVCIGITLQDHWDVVHTAEKYKANVMMLENVCYRRDVMAVW
jgi:predicted dehydrogenase